MKTFATKLSQRFNGDDNGSITLNFALILVPMIAFSGIAVDYSKAIGIRKQLQDIADSTVIAGARLPANTAPRRPLPSPGRHRSRTRGHGRRPALAGCGRRRGSGPGG